MLLDASAVATEIAYYYVKTMRNRETLGAAFAKGKFQRLVGKSSGGEQVAQEEGGRTSGHHQIEELFEVTALLSQRFRAFGSFDRFRRRIPSRELEHPDD